MDEFEIKAKKVEYGNMKGGWESKLDLDIIFLSGAEMDFPTAPVIREKLVEFAQNGLYGFTIQDERYNHSIIEWMKKVRNLTIKEEDIIPTLGTIFGLNTAIRAFSEIGDEIIIQSPSYYRFDRAVLNNARKIIYNPMIEEKNQYRIDFKDLEEKMASPKAKMMILCLPHNPTGKVFKVEELEKIKELSLKYNVIIYSDEIFGEIQFKTNISYGNITDQLCVISTSLGKAFNFTGVNHANVLIRDPILKKKYLQQRKIDHFGSIDPFFYNALLAAYSKEGSIWIEKMKQYVYAQYLYLVEELKDTPIEISKLEGGFVIWMNFKNIPVPDLEKWLLEKVKVVGDMGEEYGNYPTYVRFNIATSHQNIITLAQRLKAEIKNQGSFLDF